MVKKNDQEKNIDQINFWDTYKSDSGENIQLTNSATIDSFSIALSNNKEVPNNEDKATSDMKKENK